MEEKLSEGNQCQKNRENRVAQLAKELAEENEKMKQNIVDLQ